MKTTIPTFERFNGNGRAYTLGLPTIVWLTKEINDVALAHVEKQTGLKFIKTSWAYEAQPISFDQYVRLFVTYDFKSRYYNNWQYKNTLVIKSDHHTGFDVDSICPECAKHNHIHVNGLEAGDRVAC